MPMDLEEQLYEKVIAGYRTIIRVAMGLEPESALKDGHRKLFFAPETKKAPARTRAKKTKVTPPSGVVPERGSSSDWNMVVLSMERGNIAVDVCPMPEAYLAFLFFCQRFLSKTEDASAQSTAEYLRYLLSWDGVPWKGYHGDKIGGMTYIFALINISLSKKQAFAPLFGGAVPDSIRGRGVQREILLTERQWGPIRSFFHPLVFQLSVDRTASSQDDKGATRPKKRWMNVVMDPSLTWFPLAMGMSQTDNLNLSGERFHGALIDGWNTKTLLKLNLEDAKFYQAQVSNCDFSSCRMNGASFVDSYLLNIRFGLDTKSAMRLRHAKTFTWSGQPDYVKGSPAIATGKKHDSEISFLSFAGCQMFECMFDCATLHGLFMERCFLGSCSMLDSYLRGVVMKNCEWEWPDIRRINGGNVDISRCSFEGMTTEKYWTNWKDTRTIEDMFISSGKIERVSIFSFVVSMVDDYQASAPVPSSPPLYEGSWISTTKWLTISDRVTVNDLVLCDLYRFHFRRNTTANAPDTWDQYAIIPSKLDAADPSVSSVLRQGVSFLDPCDTYKLYYASDDDDGGYKPPPYRS